MVEKYISKETIKKILYFLVAALIPMVILQVVFSVPKVAQNSYTVLCSDLNGQYVNYFLYFRNAILNREPLTFTFSGLLGNDTAGLLGYYILSPFNIVFLMFPASEIGAAVFLVIKMKVMVTGITAGWYFGRKRDYKFSCLMFSTAYAASAYVFAYFMHVMWLDGVLILPVVAIGIDRLIDDKKKYLYVFSLVYSFVSCCYIGYMVAGFAVLYFVYKLFYIKREKIDYLSRVGLFALLSMLSGGVSALVLVPVALAQFNTGAHPSDDKAVHSFTQIISRLFTGTFDENELILGGPHVYCGLFIILLVIIGFTFWKGNVRKGLCSLFLFGSVGMSFFIDKFDLFWHIMSRPHYFNHRYAFAFVFIMVLLAEECFSVYLEKVTLINMIVADVVLIGMAIMLLVYPHVTVNRILVIIDMVCIVGFSILVYMLKKSGVNGSFVIVSIMFAVEASMLMVNGIQYVGNFSFDDRSTGGYYSEINPITTYIAEFDKGFYRVEKNFFSTTNDSMMLGYNGLSFFSSSDRRFVRDFMGELGYNNTLYWASYDRGATRAGDSLMGVKYFLSRDEYDGYEEIGRYGDVHIYRNDDSLSIGMITSSSIKGVKLTEDCPFENQEKLYSSMLGRDVDLFYMYDYSTAFSDDLAMIEQTDSYLVFERESVDGDGLCYFRFVAENNSPLYLFIPTKSPSSVILYVNGKEIGEYIDTYHQSIVPLGKFDAGTSVEIKLELTGDYVGMYRPQIASLNEDVYKEAISELQINGWSIRKHTNNRILADVIAPEDRAFFTSIPYYDGWNVYVDGKKVETYKICDTLLGFDVPKGMHSVELKYKVTGLTEGGVISAVSILALVGMYVFDRRKVIGKVET